MDIYIYIYVCIYNFIILIIVIVIVIIIGIVIIIIIIIIIVIIIVIIIIIRYLAQLLWRGEELYLQLDSHMRFVPAWDARMREQLALCGEESEKPVLCGYARGYQLGVPHDWVPPGDLTACLNCAGFFDDHNILNIRYRTYMYISLSLYIYIYMYLSLYIYIYIYRGQMGSALTGPLQK